MVIRKNFKFIDLFAGIGGFHCAMKKYSDKATCIMASEINTNAQEVYKDNFNINPLGDIKCIESKDVGKYDVVCGGFPCQTFSKAGFQAGLKDPRGTLFQEIVRIIEFQKNIEDRPKILLLENVRNLITHDNGDTWRTIKNALEEVGYNVIKEPIVIGPKDLGIPQLRDRAIILAVRKDIYSGDINLEIERKKPNTTSIYDVLDLKISEEELNKCKLTDYQITVLECWDEFMKGLNTKVIGFPIWSDEFGKNYSISDLPEWKQDFIRKNRKLYKDNKEHIDKWFKKWKVRKEFIPTHRKFEWQVGETLDSVFEGIIQFRTSGVRVKRPTEAPTLVAMAHVPIIGREKRYMTVRETARLQCFPENYKFGDSDLESYKQLGNAVNVNVIEFVFRKFVEFLDKETKKEGC